MAERQIESLLEIFPEDMVARNQFFAVLSVIARASAPVTFNRIMGEHKYRMVMLKCDETGRPANEAEVAADLAKLRGLGILQRTEEGRYSLTDFGMDLARKLDEDSYSKR